MTKPDYHFVKVFGERNTGTRALIKMLTSQPHVGLRPQGASRAPETSELHAVIEATYSGRWRKIYRDALLDTAQVAACPTKTWKHAAPVWDAAFTENKAHVVFCIRNPYSWVLSLANRPYHQRGPKPKSLLEFVTQPWLTLGRDNTAPILRSPMALWNLKLASYGTFVKRANVPTATMKFEHFVGDPVTEVTKLLTDFDIRYENIKKIGTSTKGSTRTQTEIAAYYRAERWKDDLTEDLVQAINRFTDWRVAEKYGYEKLNPSDFAARRARFTWKNLSRSHNSTLH